MNGPRREGGRSPREPSVMFRRLGRRRRRVVGIGRNLLFGVVVDPFDVERSEAVVGRGRSGGVLCDDERVERGHGGVRRGEGGGAGGMSR